MKILITTYGTLGDVQPYVALGMGLKEAGHHVILGTSERFRDFVESHGLTYGHMDDGLLSIIDTDQGKTMLENTTNIFDVFRQNIKLGKQIKPLQIAQLRETSELAKSVMPDFLIYHPKTGAAPHIAEKLGIGCALVSPIPMLVPTSEWPFPVLPRVKLGGWYNRLSYRVIHVLSGFFLGKYIRNIRHDIGLKPMTKFEVLKNGKGEDIPVLHIVSEAVLPRPSDWPTSAYMTGYCFLDRGKAWTPPATLQGFLDAGPPPVYVGFGSMAGRDPQQLAHTVVEALQLAGVRGIISTGWGGMKCKNLPDSILEIESAPHDWLFPRVSAVVHHGGAGTTAAGLCSGKPSIIVPFFGDQPFWGELVHSIGAGTKPIPRKKLTADLLAAAIKHAISNLDLLTNAEEIGQKIRHEDGVGNAVAVIEKIMKNPVS
ncbi:glycosyltransferase [Desulforhopalus sp. 52FAK]